MKNILKFFNRENIIYTIVFIVSIFAIIINRALNGFGNIIWIADFGSLFGIIYIIFLAKHSIWGMVFNIFSTIFIGTVALLQYIYFSAAFCFCVSLPLVILGLFRWKKNEKNDSARNLKTLSKKQWIIYTGILILSLPVIMVVLWKLNSTLFYLDAIATSFCFVGLMLTSNMYIEQFIFFMPANIVFIAMYAVLSFSNPNNISMIVMYFCFAVTTLMGYRNWKTLFKKQNDKTWMSQEKLENDENIMNINVIKKE